MSHLTAYAKAHLRIKEIDQRWKAYQGKSTDFYLYRRRADDEGQFALKMVADDQRSFYHAIHGGLRPCR